MPASVGEESLETIVKLDGRDSIGSQWSTVWSTTNVPGMDTATGSRGMRRLGGRRRLRFGALAVGALLTMHCRVGASAVSGGYFIFLLMLLPAMAVLGNPLRHFEIYLGQWSMSGPGRAFRILPMLDGIGIAMCINIIFRSIIYVTLAAVCGIYIFHTMSDDRLPFNYCRKFDLSQYEASEELRLRKLRVVKPKLIEIVTVGLSDLGWRNHSVNRKSLSKKDPAKKRNMVCNETFNSDKYPILPRSPAFNHFYVEIMKLHQNLEYTGFNVNLCASLLFCWGVLWVLLFSESIRNGRLIWNNVNPWITCIPWFWALVLLVSSIIAFNHQKKDFMRIIRLEAKETITAFTDAFEVAMYIHSASTGTEMIHGKGLNHYASGHIDTHLNGENVWHSVILSMLALFTSTGSSICCLLDLRAHSKSYDSVISSTLFAIPIYAKCTSLGPYSHLRSTLIFAGLMFAYLGCAFVFLKTALHTIFEYKVKLVFWEQIIVAGLIVLCMLLSLVFTTQGGLPLLESMDAVITGVGMPFICLMELIALMYVYQSSDFISDMNIATEDNSCSTRLNIQWQTLPFILAAFLLLRIIALCNVEMPITYMFATIIPMSAIVLSVPIRACHNAYIFLRPAPRHGT